MKIIEALKYRQLRAKGYKARYALSFARAYCRFQAEPRVRMNCEPDQLDYEFCDYSDCRPSDRKRFEEAERKMVEREGVWVYFSEYQDNQGKWQVADSLGSCVGKPDEDCECDLMEKALIELDKEYQKAADELAERATYAGYPA